MLGSLGRLADHIVLLRDSDGVARNFAHRPLRPEVAGRRRAGTFRLSALPPDCATALGEAAASALAERPSLSWRPRIACAMVWCGPTTFWRCRRRRAGAARWSAPMSTNADTHYNLLDTIFSATDEGVLSLAAIRDASGRPSDFQIVHLNQGAARLLGTSPRPNCYGAGSAPAATCCARPEVIERLRDIIASGSGGQIRNRPRGSQSETRRDGVRRHAVADGLGRHGAEAARSLVPPAVRQQSDADVGVRCRDDASSSASTMRPCSTTATAARNLSRHEAAPDLAGGRMGHP